MVLRVHTKYGIHGHHRTQNTELVKKYDDRTKQLADEKTKGGQLFDRYKEEFNTRNKLQEQVCTHLIDSLRLSQRMAFLASRSRQQNCGSGGQNCDSGGQNRDSE